MLSYEEVLSLTICHMLACVLWYSQCVGIHGQKITIFSLELTLTWTSLDSETQVEHAQ